MLNGVLVTMGVMIAVGRRRLPRLVVMFVRLDAVGQPYTLDWRQDHAVEHAGRRRQQADHGVGVLTVLWTAGRETMAPDERIADAQAAPGCDQRAQSRLERLLPQPAVSELGAVVPCVGMLGADDAKSRQ